MFRFEHPAFLYTLAALPILALLFFLYWRWRKRAIQRFGNPALMPQLMPEASRWKHPFKFSLLLLAIVFLIIGWANPQWGAKREKTSRKSVDIFIALDISTSMLAEDVPPSRIERAKKFGEELVIKLKGNRIGLILFAGNAYLQMPLTTDYAAAALFLRSANTNLAATQGTAIGDAITIARRSLQEDDKRHRALIIITDGEDHEGDALNQAALCKDENILLFTVGVGTAVGAFIPVRYGNLQDYHRDQSGQPVRSKLNEPMLRELAGKGGGEYFHISQSGQIAAALESHIDQLEKQEFETRSFSDYESYFKYFLIVALLLLAAEFLVSFKKEKWMSGKDLFG